MSMMPRLDVGFKERRLGFIRNGHHIMKMLGILGLTLILMQVGKKC